MVLNMIWLAFCVIASCAASLVGAFVLYPDASLETCFFAGVGWGLLGWFTYFGGSCLALRLWRCE